MENTEQTANHSEKQLWAIYVVFVSIYLCFLLKWIPTGLMILALSTSCICLNNWHPKGMTYLSCKLLLFTVNYPQLQFFTIKPLMLYQSNDFNFAIQTYYVWNWKGRIVTYLALNYINQSGVCQPAEKYNVQKAIAEKGKHWPQR